MPASKRLLPGSRAGICRKTARASEGACATAQVALPRFC